MNELFDSPGRLLLERDPPDPPRPPRRREAVQAQLERLGELQRQGFIARVGKTGATVFNWGSRL
jgi:hypothetical protein